MGPRTGVSVGIERILGAARHVANIDPPTGRTSLPSHPPQQKIHGKPSRASQKWLTLLPYMNRRKKRNHADQAAAFTASSGIRLEQHQQELKKMVIVVPIWGSFHFSFLHIVYAFKTKSAVRRRRRRGGWLIYFPSQGPIVLATSYDFSHFF